MAGNWSMGAAGICVHSIENLHTLILGIWAASLGAVLGGDPWARWCCLARLTLTHVRPQSSLRCCIGTQYCVLCTSDWRMLAFLGSARHQAERRDATHHPWSPTGAYLGNQCEVRDFFAACRLAPPAAEHWATGPSWKEAMGRKDGNELLVRHDDGLRTPDMDICRMQNPSRWQFHTASPCITPMREIAEPGCSGFTCKDTRNSVPGHAL
jgi:hypothetical protein